MSELSRLYKYKALLSGRRGLSADQLAERLEISRATLKRDLARLRDQFRVPIRFDRDRGGYYLESDGKAQELPGIWLEREEVAALGALGALVTQLQPGLLAGKLDTLHHALQSLLRKHGVDPGDCSRVVRIVQARRRLVSPTTLDAVMSAAVLRRKISAAHKKHAHREALVRTISPQKVLLYRHNWYLAGWCHLRDALRVFQVDALHDPVVLDEPAFEVSSTAIDELTASAYGVSGSKAREWAVLRFPPAYASHVSGEFWHARQSLRTVHDGSVELRIPFSDESELLEEVLRLGPQVVVVGPQALRSKVQKLLLAAAAGYAEEVL